MEKTKYDGNQVIAWDKCGWMPKEIQAPAQKGALKLSEAVRECGYGNGFSSTECVLARAYRRATGKQLTDVCGPSRGMGDRGFIRTAAAQFNVPYDVANETESLCMAGQSPVAIADWLESQGL